MKFISYAFHCQILTFMKAHERLSEGHLSVAENAIDL